MSPGCLSSLSRSTSTNSPPSAVMPGASRRGVGSKVKQACRRIEQLVTRPIIKPGEPEPIDAFLNNGPQAPDRPPTAPPLPIQNAAPRPSPYKIPYSPAFNSDPRASSVQNEQRRVNKVARSYVRPEETIIEEDTPPLVPPKGKSAATTYIPYSASEYWRHLNPRPRAIHPNLLTSQSAEILADPKGGLLTLDLASTSLSLPLGETFASETERASQLQGTLTEDGSQTLNTAANGTKPHNSRHLRPKKRQRSRSGKLQRAGLHIDVPDTMLESDQHSPFSLMTKTPPAVANGFPKRPKSLHVRSHIAEELHFDAGHRPAPTQAKTSGDMYGELDALRAGRPGQKRASTLQNLGQHSQTTAPWKVYAPKETMPSQYTPFNQNAVKQLPEERQTISSIFGRPKVTDSKAPRIASGILPQETRDILKNIFGDGLDNPAQLESIPKTIAMTDAPDIQHIRASSYRSAKYRSPRAESVPDETVVPTEPTRTPPVIPTRRPYPVTPTVPQPEHLKQPNTNCSPPFIDGACVMQARTQTVKRTQARKVSIKTQGSQKSQVKVDRLAAPLALGQTTQRQPSMEGDPLPRFYGFRGDEAATEHRRRYEERRRLRREQRQQEERERKRQEQERKQQEAQRRWEEVNDGDLIDFRSASHETSSGVHSLQGTVDQAFVFWARQEASLLD